MYISLAVGEVPPPSALSNLLEIGTGTVDPTLVDPSGIQAPINPKDTPPVTVGASLPPVPGKLVKRIQAGHFIEMGELLPERLGVASMGSDDEGFKMPKAKHRAVTTILEWAQCFGIYVAVISRTQLKQVPDLLAYQALIIQAQLEYQGDSWLGYDRTFHLRAMSQPDLKWSCVDHTLWSLAFSGKGKVNRCRHCFSLTHSSSEYGWSPGSQTSSTSSLPILGALLKPSEGFQLFVILVTTLQPPIVPTQIASMSTSAPYVLERSEQPMSYTKPFTALVT